MFYKVRLNEIQTREIPYINPDVHVVFLKCILGSLCLTNPRMTNKSTFCQYELRSVVPALFVSFACG